MILKLNNLNAGMRRWHELNFEPDFLNAEYHRLYRARSKGITQRWWDSTVDTLGRWRAYRGPTPPNSHREITELGLTRLAAIATEYATLTARSRTEPSIIDVSWDDVAPLFALAYQIKPSFVFASKMCHFVFPKLFIAMDNQLTEIFEYEFYWRGMQDEWKRFGHKQEAISVLEAEVRASTATDIHPGYPW